MGGDTERKIWTWNSPNVGRELSVARWGFYGKPVIFFPTGGGDFLDCERFLMVKALQPLIDAGRIKLYAVDSVCRWAWANREVPAPKKAAMQVRYDAYLVNELFPFIRSDCGGTDQKFAVAGASLGGYNAINAASKHPEWVDRMVGMSGTYILDRKMDGYWDENYYFNNPFQFLQNLPDGPQLHALRDSRFLLARGDGPYENPDYPDRMSRVFSTKGIPHRVEIWGKSADHDWPTWRTMLPLFLKKWI